MVSCLLPSSLQAGLALYRRSLQISAVCKLALQVYVGIDAPYLHFESEELKVKQGCEPGETPRYVWP